MSAAAMIASRRGNMRPTIGSSQKSSRYTEEAEAIRHLQKQTLTYKLRQGAFDGSDESDSGGWSSSDSSSGKHTLERRIAAKISMRKARKVDAFEFETNMSGVINQKVRRDPRARAVRQVRSRTASPGGGHLHLRAAAGDAAAKLLPALPGDRIDAPTAFR